MSERQAAFLRGINVGTAKRVSMADLQKTVEAAGFSDVSTLLNSGNVVLTSSLAPEQTAATLTRALADELRLTSEVIVRSAAELDAVAAACPWPEHQDEGSKLFVGFLAAAPATVDLDPVGFLPELWTIVGREVWQWSPDGLSHGRLWKTSWDARLGVVATMRNWNTLAKVRAKMAP